MQLSTVKISNRPKLQKAAPDTTTKAQVKLQRSPNLPKMKRPPPQADDDTGPQGEDAGVAPGDVEAETGDEASNETEPPAGDAPQD